MAACTRFRHEKGVFVVAERCMEAYPDSALQLLNDIKHPEMLRGKSAATYALLMTQARDKNYLDSLQSDSLISIAAKYDWKDDNAEAGKSWYYYGKVLALKKQYSDAMVAYRKSLEYLEKAKKHKMLGLVWEHVGYLNATQRLYATSVSDYKQSVRYYRLAGDSRKLIRGYRNIARGYMAMNRADSVQWYSNRGIHLCDSLHAEGMKAPFWQMLGCVARINGHYDEAQSYFLSAIRHSRDVNEVGRYYLSLGINSLTAGNVEEAEDYFLACLDAKDEFVLSGAYQYLSDISKRKGNYKDACGYKEQADSLLAVVHNIEYQKSLTELRRKYENEKLVLENKQVRAEKQKQAYFYLLLLLVIVSVSIVLFRYLRRRYQKHFMRYIETIKRNERLMKSYLCKIADMEKEGRLEQEINKNRIAELNRKILLLSAENKKIRENASVEALYLLEELKAGRLVVENLTEQEKQHIFTFLDLVHAGFISRISKDFKLTKNELLLAGLLKIGFSNKQLMLVFDCEIDSVYKSRQRLKQHLKLGKNDSLEQMIALY